MNGSRGTGTPGGMDFRVLPLTAATGWIVTVRAVGAIPPGRPAELALPRMAALEELSQPFCSAKLIHDAEDHEGESDETVGAVRAGPGRLPTRLSEDLRRILEHADGKGVTIGKAVEILRGRGLDVLVILLALPFCTPIPLPGLSTPFGLVLMFLGLRIAFRKRPWLPRRLLEMEIPYPSLSKLITAGLAVSTRLEKVLHPRLRFFKDWISFSFLNGLAILLSAFVLSLPLPIPFTNALPALSIVLIAAGMMEDDGAVILAGYLMSGLTWVYLGSLVWVGKVGLTWMGF